MKAVEFRSELSRVMPSYKWTIRQNRASGEFLVAIGTQSSGSNRLSTLQVERRNNYACTGLPRYAVKSAGYGRRAPWLHEANGPTLARALRLLQEHYEQEARKYSSHAAALEAGRNIDAAVSRGDV